MDYPDDAFHPFMDLDSVIYYAANGTAFRFASKISSIVFRGQTKLLRVWNDMRVSD